MQPLHVVLVVSGALCLAAVAVLVAKRKGKEGGEPGPKRARLSGPLGAFGFTVAEGPADVEAGGRVRGASLPVAPGRGAGRECSSSSSSSNRCVYLGVRWLTPVRAAREGHAVLRLAGSRTAPHTAPRPQPLRPASPMLQAPRLWSTSTPRDQVHSTSPRLLWTALGPGAWSRRTSTC